jgi:pimeloyl-ACP methyl ester carboxylesterase
VKRRFALAALLAGCLIPAVTLGGDDWKKSFGEKFNSPNSWEKAAAVKQLDPNSADQLKMLFKVCDMPDWYLRSTAADVLAGKFDTKATDEIKKELKKGTGSAAEVIATAYGRSKDNDKTDELTDVLKGKSTEMHVKRAAAIALGLLPTKKGVGALIEALDKEAKNFMVDVHILEALEKATGEKNYHTAQDWKGWWTGAETSWEPGKAPEGDSEDAKSGDRVRTTVRGTDLDFRSRGKGRPLLVLPEYGYEKDYFETYLRNLEESNQILYMKLPGTVDFKNPPLENAPNLPQPFYPIDRLVDTLEDLRKQLIADKKISDKQPLAMMGHGITCWVAIRYANKYPKSISRLVLLSAYGSERAFSRDIKAMEQQGKGNPPDQELEHHAQTLQWVNGKPLYQGANDDDNNALSRKAFTVMFGNWGDLEIGRIYGPHVDKKISDTQTARCAQVERPMGGCFVPQFDIAKEPVVQQPTLIIGGDKAFFGTPDDCAELQRQFAAANVQIIKGSRMPMIEDNAKFLAAMQKHLH